MTITKNLIVLILSGIMLSCNSDNDAIEKTESVLPIEYTFVKMEFINTEQSVTSEHYLNTPTIIYSNNTSLAQTFPYNPLNGVYETSQFSGFDSSIIDHIINSPIIAVPIRTDNNIYLGEAKWPISYNTERQQTNLNLERKIQIDPKKKLTIKTKIHYLKITTKTKLTVIDNKENKEHSIEGKWVGVYPINAEIETIFTDL